MKKAIKSSMVLLAAAATISAYAGEHHSTHHTAHDRVHTQTGVEALSPELRELLSQEMKALQKGMMSLVPELASGNWSGIEKIAKKIEESYILKQKLTKEQAEELHSKLPTSFIELDSSFHKDAGMLVHVAKNRNAELANFYFFKMNNACVNCHSKFATHRFPALKTKKSSSGHKH
ncbi:hypothetical protein NNO_1045 [Hydrogenimonas sp.]|nr:hypothetical protein NNO_1045 [Hydrogenimonas sp.]